MSYTKVLIFESEKEVLQCDHLFTVLYRVVLTFVSVDEILKCDCSNHATVYCVEQGGSDFSVCG